MATTLYRSTDGSAPTMSGTAGDLIAVLDACLVNGYGAKAAAGWTKVFSGTNKAVYQAPAGTQFYLRVLDDGSDGTNGARVASVRGYESMSDVDTGTGDYPTVAQQADGLFFAKSSTADAATRPWAVVADSKRVIILGAYISGDTNEQYKHVFFGDLISTAPGDSYCSSIFGATTSANAVSTVSPGNTAIEGVLCGGSAAQNFYTARDHTGVGGSTVTALFFVKSSGSGASLYTAGPDVNGNVWAEEIIVFDGSVNTAQGRGTVPGILFLTNYLDSGSIPSWTTVSTDVYVIRFNGTLNAYLLDTRNWE